MLDKYKVEFNDAFTQTVIFYQYFGHFFILQTNKIGFLN